MRGPAGSAPVAPDVAARLATGARRAWGACVTAARLLVGVPAAAAQITGTVDIGVSTVRYDGFLPSGAAAVTPALRWDRPAGTVTASGTYPVLRVATVACKGSWQARSSHLLRRVPGAANSPCRPVQAVTLISRAFGTPSRRRGCTSRGRSAALGSVPPLAGRPMAPRPAPWSPPASEPGSACPG